jgi:DNA-binding GntR family transcriptional regulator
LTGGIVPRRTEQALADEIHARLIEGDWSEDGWLRQAQLAEEFRVSRTPIRQALQTLSERGVVELIPNRGARIRVPTQRELGEAYVVRAVLEGVAAEAAAELASQEQLARLLAAERLFTKSVQAFAEGAAGIAESRAAWQAANDDFHEVLQEASYNQVLHATIRTLHLRFPRNLTWGVLDDVRLLTENVKQHRAICEAVERRDGPAARALMEDHVRRSGNLLTTRLTLPA